jgi:hypothetical protein
MDMQEFADLGRLLRALQWRDGVGEETLTIVRRLIRVLELEEAKRVRTNPRVATIAPAGAALLVYGYNDWSRGHEKDRGILAKLPLALAPVTFVAGPGGRRWPARAVGRYFHLAPFSVGLDVFSFYFADVSGFPMGQPERFVRVLDYVAISERSGSNPVVFSAYTQGIGSRAERYTGLSILEPTLRRAGLSYVEMEFGDRTGWGNL